MLNLPTRSRALPRPLVLISTAVALSLLGDQMLYAVLPVVHQAAGIPVTAIGLLLSANRLVRLVTNSVAGYVIERYGRRWPFIVALLLGGGTTMAYGIMHGIWAFFIARLLWGTAWSFIRIEGLSTALDVATDDTRGRYMGVFQAISRLGSAVAMLVGGILTDVIGFRLTFMLFGMATCLATLLAWLEMRSRGSSDVAHVSGGEPRPASEVTEAPEAPPAAVPAARFGSLWHTIVVCAGTFSALLVIGGLVSATLGYMLRLRFGDTITMGTLSLGVASLTGVLLSSRGFLELGFAPITGYCADRWGRHRIIIVAMPLGALLVAILGLQSSLPIVAGVTILIFLAGITLNVAFNAVAGDIAPPDKRSMFLSLFVTFQDLGAAVGPLFGYWIAPRFGLVWLYLSAAAILLAMAVLYTVTFARWPRASSHHY
jgi:MFS family permease